MSNKYNVLKVGQVYKSYRQVCEVLNEKPKSGNSKNSQLTEWKRFFKYEKDGNKFIITEVYDVELEKEELRGRKSIYGHTIQLLILDMLGYKNGKISISKSQLLKSLRITNENYGLGKVNIKKLSNYLDIEESYLYDFYNTSSSSFTSIISSALDSLQKKRIIYHNRIIKVKVIENSTTTVATDDQVRLILAIEKEALEYFKYDDIDSIRNSKDFLKFKRRVSDSLKNNTNMEYYYSAYNILINDNYINSEKDSLVSLMLSKFMREKHKNELNNLIIDNTIKNAKNRSENCNKNSKTYEVRSKFDYVDNIEVLCNNLLSNKADTINLNQHKDERGLAQEQLNEIDDLF